MPFSTTCSLSYSMPILLSRSSTTSSESLCKRQQDAAHYGDRLSGAHRVMLLTTKQRPHLERQVIRLWIDDGRAGLRGATDEVHANVALRVEQPTWRTTVRSAHIELQE
jgi:hypothetical protein